LLDSVILHKLQDPEAKSASAAPVYGGKKGKHNL